MNANFVEINSIQKLEELFESSDETPVLLFKHSSTCSISFDIYREMAAISAEINLVVVQTARHISDLIAEKTGIRHQSPQAIVLKNGRTIYHASHYDISTDEIQKNMESPENL